MFFNNVITRKKLINKNHNDFLTEHFKINKTLKLLKRKYY